ncbi:rod shape-determining protein RodA [Candidatus Daviesbacteria bacterium RIFCSPLOWO2_01_FULL_43_38]|uniref:Rod shape-determining protein RodA n=2 Tax=Candidatus Daviesiibacteriota TaxID=1752718 RepID=A0A1F5K046_9BACT|nr:MAG: Cell elongation-specific peptidoglycan biosynthesis regulator RodA [Candidatus Daviesbacteria bacterium GW2011_GWA2_42_7]OGE34264.1 MAG: rod shape-determining protein RodA [Candidatus Daviesbacteria bacterium RIFCSPHIGHO2_12_FULL_43_11]OGE63773.1 MAG: rod shape-determining protein RodA [Candidatus Daviesbacteria bacterium RIFCSPLOWO2_01_FULL_43_38]
MIKRPKVLPDLLITLPVILLLSLGVLVIYSSDPRLAIQQIVFALIGLLIYWFLSLVDFQSYNNYTKYLYIGVLALLLIVFIVGIETRGSLRWIQVVGINLQPSELAKPVLILFLAKFWSSSRANWLNIFKSFLFIVPLLGLVFKQPDLGTALTLLMIWLVMLVGANISAVKLAIMGFVSLIFMPVAWIFLQDYQKSRILSFFSPFNDPLGSGYNVIQSTIAVGSGEILGRGLGRGTQSRLQFLPEYRTDFIFASIAEEFGFLVSVVVVGLYGLVIGRSLKIIQETRSRFGSLLVFGVLGMLFFQIVVNIGMNIGVAPVTGITLPLLSYGGSSIIATLISLGLIASVARFNKKREELG